MRLDIPEFQTPQYINIPNFDPRNYSLSHYKERSRFQSNVIEFWAPITDIVIPYIIPNRYLISSWGRVWNTSTNTPAGFSMHRKGYYQTHFAGYDEFGNYKVISRKIHVLVMKTFCWFPECDNFIINHMDCNKLNNTLGNLEWCTESENTIHAIQHEKKIVFGDSNARVVLTDDQVGEVYRMINEDHMKYKEILEALNVSPNDVSYSLIKNIGTKKARIAYFKKMGMYP